MKVSKELLRAMRETQSMTIEEAAQEMQISEELKILIERRRRESARYYDIMKRKDKPVTQADWLQLLKDMKA